MTTFCPTTPAKLYSLGNDEFARETATGFGCLSVLIQEADSWVRSGNVQSLDADSVALVKAKDLQSLVDHGRVEGYLLHVCPYDKNTWYRIDSVSVARDLLQNNQVMHYELAMSRSKEPLEICEAEEDES